MEKISGQKEGLVIFQEREAKAFEALKNLKKEGKTEAFGEKLLQILPQVKAYMGKRFNSALNRGMLPKGKYKVDDFVDQLFLEAFEHFDEVTNKWDLNPWLFKKADELFDDVFVEEEFDAVFFENIDKYSQPEWKAMEEKFSTDGDGDLVMLEELDDISYRRRDYLLKNIFLDDDKKGLMAKLDRQLDRDTITRHVNLVLHHMPEQMQTVFQLHVEQLFNMEEIAMIKNIAVGEVEQLLKEAEQHLEKSFYYRYIMEDI